MLLNFSANFLIPSPSLGCFMRILLWWCICCTSFPSSNFVSKTLLFFCRCLGPKGRSRVVPRWCNATCELTRPGFCRVKCYMTLIRHKLENRVLNETYTPISRRFLEVQASIPPVEAFLVCSPLPEVSFSFPPSPKTLPRPIFLLLAKHKLQEVVEAQHLNPSHHRKELASEVMMVLRVVVSEAVYSIHSLRAMKAQLCGRQRGRVAEPVCNRRLRQNPRLM
jgi:hypothetical protein